MSESKKYYANVMRDFIEELEQHQDLLEQYKNVVEKLKGEIFNG